MTGAEHQAVELVFSAGVEKFLSSLVPLLAVVAGAALGLGLGR